MFDQMNFQGSGALRARHGARRILPKIRLDQLFYRNPSIKTVERVR